MFGKEYAKKTPYQTPQQKAIEKRHAAKHGKAIIPLLANKYVSNDVKVANDPELKKFLDETS